MKNNITIDNPGWLKRTGDILKEYIGDKSQKTLADEIGIDESYLSGILNNKRPPSKRILDYFVKTFEISIADISAIDKFESYKKINEEWKIEICEMKIELMEKDKKIKRLEKFEKLSSIVQQIALEDFIDKGWRQHR